MYLIVHVHISTHCCLPTALTAACPLPSLLSHTLAEGLGHLSSYQLHTVTVRSEVSVLTPVHDADSGEWQGDAGVVGVVGVVGGD